MLNLPAASHAPGPSARAPALRPAPARGELHTTALTDSSSTTFLDFQGYMRGLMQAINRDKCNVIAYTAWSLADNYEWGVGFE